MGLTIKRARIKVIHALLYENNAIPANDNPAAGIGNPLKYPIVGLILNLANLKAPIVGNRINAKEVKIEGVAIVWNKSAGATPKLTISAKESNSTPNSLFTFNFLAILPSRKSKTAEKKMRMEAAPKYSLIFKVIEKTPHNKFPIVNKFGITFTSWLNKFVPPKLIKLHISVAISIYSSVILKNIWPLYYCKLIKFR